MTKYIKVHSRHPDGRPMAYSTWREPEQAQAVQAMIDEITDPHRGKCVGILKTICRQAQVSWRLDWQK